MKRGSVRWEEDILDEVDKRVCEKNEKEKDKVNERVCKVDKTMFEMRLYIA